MLSRFAREARRLLREAGGRRGLTESVYGPLLVDTPADKTFEFCVTGYGPFISETIASYEREFLFLDIGANLGLFSLLADRHPLCRKVLAFEPVPVTFANLLKNIECNKAGKVSPYCLAFADAGPYINLSFNPGHSGASKVLAGEAAGSVRAKTVDAAQLTELVGEHPGSILAKIDVEGSEPTVLSTLRQTGFYSALDAIIIEVSEGNMTATAKAGLLDNLVAEGFEEVARNGPERHYDAYWRRKRETA